MTAIQKKIEILNKSQQKAVLKFIDELLEKEKVGSKNAFDSRIESDIKAGKLDRQATKALEDFRSAELQLI